jgi:hypothetical protein
LAVQAARLSAEDAEDDGEDAAKAWMRFRFAEAVARIASPRCGSRRSPAATAATAAEFDSALAAVLAVCSGGLPVRRGWRSSVDAAREISDAYDAALGAVPRRADLAVTACAKGDREPKGRTGSNSGSPRRPEPRYRTIVVPGAESGSGRTRSQVVRLFNA